MKMDFDIGNILYIIITLVVVLVGVLGKKKKPAEGGGAPVGEGRSSFMENLERVLTMGQEQARIMDLQEYEQDLTPEEYAYEEPEQDVQAEGSTGLSLMEEYERLIQRRSETNPFPLLEEGGIVGEALQVIDLEEEYGTDYFEIVRDFDAGKAIVYSAIIDRLDY